MLLIRTLQIAAFLVLCFQCESKLITSLPGLDREVGFKQYSDYITVGETNEKRLFYWYMESQSDPATDPLVLWLNGGPGCSSMSGVLGEIGPFYVRPNITLGINKYSWNRVVNLLFIDSPAGIGFSKSGVHNCSTGDVQTTRDLFTFLIKFFKSFPHLKSHDFWITGESYAGHYIPNLAQWIVQHNTAKDFSFQHIKLKGFMIGNPLTNAYVDTGGYVDFVFSHQLISNQTYHELRKHCNFSSSSGTSQYPDYRDCMNKLNLVLKEMGPVNPYDIYVDVCGVKGYDRSFAMMELLAASDHPISAFYQNYVRESDKAMESGNVYSPYMPCLNQYDGKYLNDPMVQKALHADPTHWSLCNATFRLHCYSAKDFWTSMLPVYQDSLLHRGLKILLYSGDVDSIVPAISTRRNIEKMNLKLTSKWKYWMDSNNQVGGYTEVYDGLTYATVRNAGHEVPSFQPLRAYDMFTRFIKTGSVIQK